MCVPSHRPRYKCGTSSFTDCFPLSVVSLRKAMDNLTLTDGTFLPKGTVVAAVASPIHHDASLYPSPDTFDPFRFSSMFDAEGPNVTQRFTHMSARWLTFGYGRHAW